MRMKCKLAQEVQSLPSTGFFPILQFINLAKVVTVSIGIDDEMRCGLTLKRADDFLSIVTVLATKYERILNFLFGAKIGSLFACNQWMYSTSCGSFSKKKKLANWVLEMFYMLITFLQPLTWQRIVHIEFILTRVISKLKYFKDAEANEKEDKLSWKHLDILNYKNDSMLSVYNALVLKLKFQKIQAMFRSKYKAKDTDIANKLIEMQPFYDYFVKQDASTKKSKISYLLWFYVENELTWIDFLSGKLSIGSKLECLSFVGFSENIESKNDDVENITHTNLNTRQCDANLLHLALLNDNRSPVHVYS